MTASKNPNPQTASPILSSLWDGLSPHLIASFFQCDKDGLPLEGPIVKAPLTEAELEMSLNWQSPFEQAGPESKAPALMAMLQSGALQPFADIILGEKKESQENSSSLMAAARRRADDFLNKSEGRTGITKLNSTQVFTGMPPVKIQVQALFRAWLNPQSEVEAPVNQLMEWALPEKLSNDGTILTRLVNSTKGERDAVEALMPSVSPVMIGFAYKGRMFAPMVIESIGQPLSSPVDSSGKFVEMLVPMTISSLTAIDKEDWQNITKSNL